MLTLILLCFLLVFLIGGLASVVIFCIDVILWHDKEEHEVILPSNSPEPDPETAAITSVESEVKENERTVAESGEYNSSAFSFPWSQP